jgi:hypothetical protein
MKRIHTIASIIGLFLVFTHSGKAQINNDRLGLPGDNLNLAAVLDIFQKSPTLEGFEAALNSDTSRVNNLDLNSDGKVDYIKVYDKADGDLHTIVLQVDINDQESQDVAVIFVEKKGNDIDIQMVGDEDLYGKDYVLEPSTDNSRRPAQTRNPGYKGEQTVINNYYYNTNNNNYDYTPNYAPVVSSWVIIQYMYSPFYRPWYSPWRWSYYPGWYRPWNPWYWDTYHYHWYYHHSWNGWWYWRAPQFHYADYWYGPYRLNRRASGIYYRNRMNGIYERTYNNPRPEPRPTGRPKYANHNLCLDKNPAIVRPDSRPDRRITSPTKDVRPDTRPTSPVKDVRPDRRSTSPTKDVRPDTRPTSPSKDVRPDTRPTSPTKDVRPDTRPSTPQKETRPSKPVSETKQSTQPSRQQETRPSQPVRETKQYTQPSRQQETRPTQPVREQKQYTQPSRQQETRPSQPVREQKQYTQPSRQQETRPSTPARETRKTETGPSRPSNVSPAQRPSQNSPSQRTNTTAPARNSSGSAR